MADKIFAQGMYFKKEENSPDYVIGNLSIKVPEAIPFIQQHENNAGYVNIDIKKSKGGKLYCELNTYIKKSETPKNEVEENQKGLSEVKTKSEDTIEYPEEDINPEDIPF